MPTSHVNVSDAGMAQSDPPEPCIIVIYGVAGDLARRTLIPALYALHCRQLLPAPFAIIGVARREWDDDAFREKMQRNAQAQPLFKEETWRRFAQHLYFVGGDLSASANQTYRNLRDALAKQRDERQMPNHVLFHLSTPPALYGDISNSRLSQRFYTTYVGWLSRGLFRSAEIVFDTPCTARSEARRSPLPFWVSIWIELRHQ